MATFRRLAPSAGRLTLAACFAVVAAWILFELVLPRGAQLAAVPLARSRPPKVDDGVVMAPAQLAVSDPWVQRRKDRMDGKFFAQGLMVTFRLAAREPGPHVFTLNALGTPCPREGDPHPWPIVSIHRNGRPVGQVVLDARGFEDFTSNPIEISRDPADYRLEFSNDYMTRECDRNIELRLITVEKAGARSGR
jgi:hypothetical protein